jgi:hypothetical protein
MFSAKGEAGSGEGEGEEASEFNDTVLSDRERRLFDVR